MTDKEILKALGLSKKSYVSEQIVQTTHHWLDACEKVAELKKENAKLIEQIADLKNYCCEVSKYLHDNSMIRPNSTACKKRDTLLVKEFKLCEKWGDLK